MWCLCSVVIVLILHLQVGIPVLYSVVVMFCCYCTNFTFTGGRTCTLHSVVWLCSVVIVLILHLQVGVPVLYSVVLCSVVIILILHLQVGVPVLYSVVVMFCCYCTNFTFTGGHTCTL